MVNHILGRDLYRLYIIENKAENELSMHPYFNKWQQKKKKKIWRNKIMKIRNQWYKMNLKEKKTSNRAKIWSLKSTFFSRKRDDEYNSVQWQRKDISCKDWKGLMDHATISLQKKKPDKQSTQK